MFCHNCGKKIRDDARFCPECGANMASVCRKCGAEMGMNEKFCSQCGASVVNSGQAPSIPVMPIPIQNAPVAPAQRMLAAPAAPMQEHSDELGQSTGALPVETPVPEKTKSVMDGNGRLEIVGGRQIWRAHITEIPTEIKIERLPGPDGKKKVSVETFYKYSYDFVSVRDENGKLNTKSIKKAKKSSAVSFTTDEIKGVAFKTGLVFYLSDILRIIFIALFVPLTYGCALAGVAAFLFLARCRQLHIQLRNGNVVKIPLMQDADAAVFLQVLGFPAKAGQAAQKRISENSWKLRTFALNYAVILIAGLVTGVGIDMSMENNATYTVSESMSAKEKSVLEYIQNYEYEDSGAPLQDVLEYALGSGEWDCFRDEDSEKELYVVDFWFDEDNEIQLVLSEGDMEEGLLGDFYAKIEGERIRSAAGFEEWLENAYIDYFSNVLNMEF